MTSKYKGTSLLGAVEAGINEYTVWGEGKLPNIITAHVKEFINMQFEEAVESGEVDIANYSMMLSLLNRLK